MADVLAQLPQTVIENMIMTLKETNASKLAQIQAAKNQLINLVSQLTALNQRQALFNNKYSSYFAAYSQYLDSDLVNDISAYTQQVTDAVQLAELDTLVTQLLAVEHKIMELIDPTTATTRYAILYNDGMHAEQLAYGEVSAEDLYNSGALRVVDGKLMLFRGQLSAALAKGSSHILTQEELDKFHELARTAIEDMRTELQILEDEYNRVTPEYRSQHLGRELWCKYNKLVGLFRRNRQTGNEYNVESLFRRFTAQTLEGFSLRGLDYNRGHVAEAFERWLQDTSITDKEALRASMDNLPWFAGGDVGSTQVKSLFNQRGLAEESVKIASISSILDLARMLLQYLMTPDQFVERAKEVLTNQLIAQKGGALASEILQERIRKSVEELINNQLKSSS